MNKFKIFYIIMIIISIIMIFTKSFYGNVIIYSYNDADNGIIDGFQGNVFLSIINCFIIAIIMILTLIMTFNKKNNIHVKWLWFVIIILLSVCIPIGVDSYSGGVAGIVAEKNLYLWNLLIYL